MKVVHCKKEKFDVYIGRPTIYGNPFVIGKDGNREEVIVKFHWYFHAKLARDKEFLKIVLTLKGKKLGCYCKPLACHGDEIVTFVDNYEE